MEGVLIMIWARRSGLWIMAGVILFLSSSCGTTGGKQVETVIYDMHRRVTKMDKNFDNINTTFADLSVRLDNADQSMRELKSVVEETQIKLNQLSKELSDLKTTLYKHLNLTVSSNVPQPTTPFPRETTANVEILPPTLPPSPTTNVPPSTSTTEQVQSASSQKTTTQTQLAEAPDRIETAPSPNPENQFQEALNAYTNGRYDESLKKFDEFIKQNPLHLKTPDALYWKAKCLLNLSKYEEAIKEFDTLKTNFPNHNKVPIALQNEAVAYSKLGQYDKAKALLREIIEKYPTTPAAEQAKSDLGKLEKMPQ